MKFSKKNAVREAKSREELKMQEKTPYGVYSSIFDRRTVSVDRYLERGMELPSWQWTREFVEAGGSFDSCGSWGVTPRSAIELEGRGIVPAAFAGEMLAILGRSDYDFSNVEEVYETGIYPTKRAEFHAAARGVYRMKLALAANAGKRSLMRLGWMTDLEFSLYLFKTSRVINSSTNHWSFNGLPVGYDDEDYAVDLHKTKNTLFQKWLAARPGSVEMERRGHEKKWPVDNKKSIGLVSKLPARLVAVAIRLGRPYVGNFIRNAITTTVGRVTTTHDNLVVVYNPSPAKEAKTIIGRVISPDMAVAKIKNMWFVWDPKVGFHQHMENIYLKQAILLFSKRSLKGTPRPLSLNNVRNDVQGTAGFCLSGTKSFLQKRMPFVYRLIRQYSSWSQIPAEIMSTVWDIDFKVFQGYPVP